MSTACQFDPQLLEVEGCSDIYEFNLANIVLHRPATIRIPLPQWLIERREKNRDNWEQFSATINSSEAHDTSNLANRNGALGIGAVEKSVIVLYQASAHEQVGMVVCIYVVCMLLFDVEMKIAHNEADRFRCTV